MFIPLIPRDEALALLEDASHAQEARSEFLAEQGSSYFYGGMSSADATFMASRDWNERENDFLSSPEGQEYDAKLEAAILYQDVAMASLSGWDIPELVIEWKGGYVTREGIADGQWPMPRTSWEHSPFPPTEYRLILSDDIPF